MVCSQTISIRVYHNLTKRPLSGSVEISGSIYFHIVETIPKYQKFPFPSN